MLCLTLLLGLHPDPAAGALVTLDRLGRPTGSRGRGSRASERVGRVWSVEVRNGTIVVNET